MPRGGKVELISCEEDAEEAKRRQEQMAKFLGTTRADLAQAMRIASWVDNDSTQLMELDRKSDNVRPTDLYHRLVHETATYQPRLIILDTAADLFGGSEISRNHTRTFISYMRRLALAANNSAAVILLTHPSLEGIRSGSGLSGSTAWHNSVRSRCVFKHYQLVRCRRCKVIKRDGQRCKAPAVRGLQVCRMHGGQLVLWRRRMKKAKVVKHERFSIPSPKERKAVPQGRGA